MINILTKPTSLGLPLGQNYNKYQENALEKFHEGISLLNSMHLSSKFVSENVENEFFRQGYT